MTFTILVAATLTCGLLIGLIPTLVDGLKQPLRARLNLADGREEWFARYFYLAWLPAMPLAGWLLDTWLNERILFVGLVGLILGVAWLALVRSSLSLMFNSLFIGLAYSFVTTATVRLMTVALVPNDTLATERLNIPSLNFGFVMVGAGAMLGPWVVKLVESWWGYRHGLLYLSVVLIGPATLVALCGSEIVKRPTDIPPVSWTDILTHEHVALLTVVILLYFAVENCMEFWPESYLKELGYQERGLQIGMVVFGLAFIASRGAAAWWLYHHPGHGFPLTIILVLVSAFVLGNLAGGYEVGSGSLGFGIVGACYGPLLPGFVGMALEMFQAPLPVTVLGALLALSGLDTLLMRPLMHAVGKDRPVRTVMRVPAVLALIMAAPLFLLAFLRK